MYIIKQINRFIRTNMTKVILLTVVMVTLIFLAQFPYFNSLIGYPYAWNSLLILFIFSVAIFRLDETFSFGAAFIFLIISAILFLLRKDTFAQTIGNIVYYLLWFGSIQTAVHIWRGKKYV